MQAQLKRVELDVQQMISERQQKVEEIKKSVDHYKVSPHQRCNIFFCSYLLEFKSIFM